MSNLAAIDEAARKHGLFVSGAFHLRPEDGVLNGAGTLILLSPAEPGFWAHVTAQTEWRDGAANPLDRWSERVVGRLAAVHGGEALFPFGGPPYHPFIAWAQRSGRAWASPVTLLVHEIMGLFGSYRGAIVLADRLELPATPAKSPCETCAPKPCQAACPPGALTAQGYNLPACHSFLDTAPGDDCLSGGCRVRRACPISETYGRLAQQSAYHMRLFHT